MKRIVSIITALAMTLGVSVSSFATNYDPTLDPIPSGFASISIGEDAMTQNNSQIFIQPPAADENLVRGEWIWCNTLEDPACDYSNPKNDIMGWAILPPCESEADENCIEPPVISSGGTEVTGVFQGLLSTERTYPANERLKFYEASAPSIFRVPGVIHGGGTDLYMVSARTSVRYQHSLGHFTTEDLTTSVIPITPEPRTSGPGPGVFCLQLSPSSCAVPQIFPADVRVRVGVRLADEVGGWFFGRMKDPLITAAAFSQTNNRVVVEAEPVAVPRLNVKVAQSALTLEDRKAMGNSGSTGELGVSDKVYIGTAASDETVFRLIEYFRPWVNDTAAGTTSLWSFKTISNGPGNQCLADKTQVLGIVTTNAMGYNGNSPAYVDGFLNYRVAGLHYAPGGKELNLGTYDLVMRSETARCLYGFSRAPVSATVSVIGDGGEENVATTVVSEKDGWLKLAAYGFTFSEKQIKVRVTQAQSRTLTPFARNATSLTTKQRSEIRAIVSRGASNPKFICTGIRLEGQPQAVNTLVRQRAKAACDYAKSLNPRLSTFFQTRTTKAASFNGKVLIVSK